MCNEAHHVPALPSLYQSPRLFVRTVMEMANDKTFQVFKELRWSADEEVACPVCGKDGKRLIGLNTSKWLTS